MELAIIKINLTVLDVSKHLSTDNGAKYKLFRVKINLYEKMSRKCDANWREGIGKICLPGSSF